MKKKLLYVTQRRSGFYLPRRPDEYNNEDMRHLNFNRLQSITFTAITDFYNERIKSVNHSRFASDSRDDFQNPVEKEGTKTVLYLYTKTVLWADKL